ncbi:Cell wall protein ecm33, partial [Smittium mucronatum]
MGSTLTTIDLSNIEEVQGNVSAFYNDNLTSLKMDGLKSLSGDFNIFNNSALVEFSAKSLSTVNDFIMTTNMNLTEFDLSSLSQASGFYILGSMIPSIKVDNLLKLQYLHISLNPYLEHISSQKLISISGSLILGGNLRHPDVQLPNLVQVQDSITMNYISDFNASNLASTGGDLNIFSNEFKEFSLESFKSVGGSLTFLINDDLNSIKMPELTDIGKGMIMIDNKQPLKIQEDTFPKLNTVGNGIVISGDLETFMLPGISRIFGNVIISTSKYFDCADSIIKNSRYTSGFYLCRNSLNSSSITDDDISSISTMTSSES